METKKHQKGTTMRRIATLIIALSCLALVFGCEDQNGRKFGGRAWDHNLSISELALERAIISDIMGGIASEVVQPDLMTLSGLEPEAEETTEETTNETTEQTAEETQASINVQKISISVPWSRTITSSSETTSDSFEYAGPEGGSLTIDVFGNLEKVSPHMNDDKTLLFSPLSVIFTFDHYTYPNSCGLMAMINGVLSCRVNGSVDRETDLVEITGNCTSGSESTSGSLLYKLSEEEVHDVFLQTNLKAIGPWYELTSYKFFGTYMLDRRGGTIDSVLASSPGICTEE